MRAENTQRGHSELRAFGSQNKALFWTVAVFSLFVNLLMLTGPIYMLQVYDRVLGSGSVETLVALSLLLVFLYAVMGVLDHARTRIMARIGARFQDNLDRRVFDATLRKLSMVPDARTIGSLGDVQSVQRLLCSPVLIAGFDLPWTLFFFVAIFIVHPFLGWLALSGAAVLTLITLANQMLSRRSQTKATSAELSANGISAQIWAEAETVRAMGMGHAAFHMWRASRNRALKQHMQALDIGGGFRALTKTLRLFLQSAMLGMGAWLVMSDQMTAGGMIASSILLGRALAPIETILGQWPVAQQAFQGWGNLALLLGAVPVEAIRTTLPVPPAALAFEGVCVVPPGERRATLRGLTFSVAPGQAVGVIGPSGAGKSTLSRTIVGLWPCASGSLRLGGASLDQYASEVLGRYIGYLPQNVQLFDGTIARNIARLSDAPDEAKVVAAAKRASAHEMIVELPKGYDTLIEAGQSKLSGGQVQRIALARALYDDPVIVVLDEPNSNLDNAGSIALNDAVRALKARGSSVLIMAHRPAAIQECDMLLVLDAGTCSAFGPKKDVLASMVKNARDIKVSPMTAKGAA